jgi:predicted nucleotidyltransferase
VQQLKPILSSRSELVFAYLHGTFLGGEPFRDVDLAVYVTWVPERKLSFRQYELDLSVELTQQMRLPVDVRVLNDAPMGFRYHIFKGRLLLVKDRELLGDVRARTWDDYFDFAPFARRYFREAIGE